MLEYFIGSGADLQRVNRDRDFVILQYSFDWSGPYDPVSIYARLLPLHLVSVNTSDAHGHVRLLWNPPHA